MHRSLFALTLLLSSLAHAALTVVPNASAFTGWTDNRDYDDQVINVTALKPATLCAGDSLYPAHPQQDLKIYHGGWWGGYDLAKLRGADSVCLTPFAKNSTGTSYCGRADTANDVILSDVFTDGCGHLVRGFVEVQFMTSDESMGTLESPGRTMYPTPHATYDGDLRAGGTYAVLRSRFMKIAEPFAGDSDKSAKLQSRALANGYTLAPTHLFAEPTN